MRKVCLKIHRWLAIPFGIFCCLACFTGAILVFQTELLRVLNSDMYGLKGDEPLESEALAQKVLDQLAPDQRILFIRIPAERGEPAEVNIAGKTMLANPYTGELFGYPRFTSFFEGTKSLHRWLWNRPKNHWSPTPSVGRVIMGTSAIAMTLILISGIVLWWPKNKKMLKTRLQVATTKGFRRFVYDSHASLGIYAVVFLLIMSLTGPTWSFGWYQKAARAIAGARDDQNAAPPSGDRGPGGGPNGGGPNGGGPNGGGPNGNGGPRGAHVGGGPGGQGGPGRAGGAARASAKQVASEVAVMREDPTQPRDERRGDAFRDATQSLHMGRWGGWISKTLYLLAAIIGGFLPISGYYMWWKRTSGARKRRPASVGESTSL